MDDEKVRLAGRSTGYVEEVDVVVSQSHDGRVVRRRESWVLYALPFDGRAVSGFQLSEIGLVEDTSRQGDYTSRNETAMQSVSKQTG